MPAVALTDHGAMYGAVDFYKECRKNEIKPIIGCEVYMAERSRHDRVHGIDSRRYHLTLLAKNTKGYQNLMKAVTIAHTEGMYYKPRMDMDLLRQYGEGIICLSGCPGSRFVQLLKNGARTDAEDLIDEYCTIFGRDNVFIEIMNHPEVDWYVPIMPVLVDISRKFELPLVATWDSHYPKRDDKQAHETLLKINTDDGGKKKGMSIPGDYSFISPDDAVEIFRDFPGAVENTLKIADMVEEYNIPLGDVAAGTWAFPNYPVPPGTTAESELRRLTYEGFEKLGVEQTEEAVKRVEYELEVIQMKGYPSYFLCVADLIEFCRQSGIYSNTRGSAAGSMVSYLTGITNINPMQYGLIFERFLNPERPSLPDIDMDFADDRRDEVIAYTKRKYGEHAVAQIGTFGTMAARGAVRDVARALGYPYGIGDKISKMIPMGAQGFPMTLDKAMDLVPELRTEYDTDRATREIIDMSKKIEGNVRHMSVHAAGVVISPTGRIDDFSPVQIDSREGKIVTQYDMYTGDREGVVCMPKFDFLGIRNLAIMADAIDRVHKIRGVELDIERLPEGEPAVYSMLSEGDALGVFQFGSGGMRQWLKELKPSNLDDLIAMVALYRPGPMAFIPDYIARKRDPKKVVYIDPRLESILSRTYGIIIYQEDILIIAVELAGYSWLEADKFRKAVGKKLPEEMKKQHEKFSSGCVTNGMKPAVAEELWDMIETFAAYGFNKAHAGSYAQLAYRTAYMKALYFPEFMTASMTAESGNWEEVAKYIQDVRAHGYEVLPPSINESFMDFTVVTEEPNETIQSVEEGDVLPSGRILTRKIRFGLSNIKNFGDLVGREVLRERKEGGKFTSLENFLERVHDRNLNKKALEALIMSGALDEFGERGCLMHNIERILAFHKDSSKISQSEQLSLFAGFAETPVSRLVLESCHPAVKSQRLAWETELLGMPISGHKLDAWRDRREFHFIEKLKHDTSLHNKKATIGGVAGNFKETVTKKKQEKMCLFALEDFSDKVDCVMFPEKYKEYKTLISDGNILILGGQFQIREGREGFIVDTVRKLEMKEE